MKIDELKEELFEMLKPHGFTSPPTWNEDWLYDTAELEGEELEAAKKDAVEDIVLVQNRWTAKQKKIN